MEKIFNRKLFEVKERYINVLDSKYKNKENS